MLFIDNKYTRWYFSIIESANPQDSEYSEKHHIIPKSLGGSNHRSNIAVLTPRQHYICHRLLIKMTQGKAKQKMAYAFLWFRSKGRVQRRNHTWTSRDYALVKSVKIRSADDFTPEWRAKISDANRGHSRNIGRIVSEEQKEKQRATRRSNIGRPGYNVRPPCRPEKAQAIREANLGKKWVHNPANPAERKQLDPKECSVYLLQGWKPGIGPRMPQVKKECTKCNNLFMPGNVKRHSPCYK